MITLGREGRVDSDNHIKFFKDVIIFLDYGSM